MARLRAAECREFIKAVVEKAGAMRVPDGLVGALMLLAVNFQSATFDLPTLSLVAICIAGLLGLFLIIDWMQQRNVRALAWWGFTALSGIGFGLVAVVIGVLAGHGAVRFSGGKRGPGLQAIAVAAGTLAFFVASYLVNMTFINHALQERGEAWRVPFPPNSLETFYRVIALNFGVMKLVFLGIVTWEAWTIPRLPKLNLGA